jgi:hypothetical protein
MPVDPQTEQHGDQGRKAAGQPQSDGPFAQRPAGDGDAAQADPDAQEQGRVTQGAGDVVVIVAETRGGAGQPRQLAVEMVEEARQDEQPGAPVRGRGVALCQQEGAADSKYEGYGSELVRGKSGARQRLHEGPRNSLIPGYDGHPRHLCMNESPESDVGPWLDLSLAPCGRRADLSSARR